MEATYKNPEQGLFADFLSPDRQWTQNPIIASTFNDTCGHISADDKNPIKFNEDDWILDKTLSLEDEGDDGDDPENLILEEQLDLETATMNLSRTESVEGGKTERQSYRRKRQAAVPGIDLLKLKRQFDKKCR